MRILVFIRYFAAVAAFVLLGGCMKRTSSAPVIGATKPPLQFEMSKEDIRLRCKNVQETTTSTLDSIVAIDAKKRSADNTLWALDRAMAQFSLEINVPVFMKYVSPKAELRKSAHECEIETSKYLLDVWFREDLFKALEAFSKTKEAKSLKGEGKKLLKEMLWDFKRNGMALSKEKRAELLEYRKGISKLEAEFSKNAMDQADFLEVTREELDGVPEDFLKRLDKLPNDKFKVSLSYPDYFPFMENAKNSEARKRLEFKYGNRAADSNVKLLEQALVLREKAAKLLGYKNHAEYVLADRMAHTPGIVRTFLKDLEKRLAKKARSDIAGILELKKQDDPKAAQVNSWDWLYYDNQLRKNRYNVDAEAVREYFPLNIVTKGMFEIYQGLLGLKFREVKPAGAWHKDVELFEVLDATSGTRLGFFYLDLFPREGKYEHAAAFPLVEAGASSEPVSAVVANMNPPSGGKPSLLAHDEVVTFFHEFGHIMHQLLTRTRSYSFGGSKVDWDFVEAPSQMLENWVWNADVLRKMSGHYKDPTKTLPEELRKSLVAAKNVNNGMKYIRQVFLAQVDMRYHTSPQPVDSTKIWDDEYQRLVTLAVQSGMHRQAAMTHYMGGYDSGYYGYLWSEVYATDMFSKFERKGITNPEIGMDYRKTILEPGGSVEPIDLLKKFLGRMPSEGAFFKSLGL